MTAKPQTLSERWLDDFTVVLTPFHIDLKTRQSRSFEVFAGSKAVLAVFMIVAGALGGAFGAVLDNRALWTAWLLPPAWLVLFVGVCWLAGWLTRKALSPDVVFHVGYNLFWGLLMGLLCGWTPQLHTAWIAYTIAGVLGFFVGITQGAFEQSDMKGYDGWFMLGTFLGPLTPVAAVALARHGVLTPASLQAAAALGALAGLVFLGPLAVMLAANWDNSQGLRRRAALLLHNDARMEAAAPFLTRLAKTRPADAGVVRLQAIAAALAGDTAGAEAHWRRHRELEPKSVEPLVGEGMVRLRRGDVAGARERLEEAVRRQPKHAGALLGLAVGLHRSGELDRACALYDRANAAAPDALTLTRLAEAHLAAGRLDAAFLEVEAAIDELDSLFGRSWLVRGQIRLARGDAEGAETDFRQAYDNSEEEGIAEAAEAALAEMRLEV